MYILVNRDGDRWGAVSSRDNAFRLAARFGLTVWTLIFGEMVQVTE